MVHRVGILGAGEFARFMAQEIARSERLEVVAVASTSAERAGLISGVRHVESYEELVGADDVDCVYNALSNHLHLPWTVAALAQGKPVLCEKPLGVDATEAAFMHDAALASGVPLMEGYWHLFHPRFALFRELIHAGVVGNVTHVNAGFAHEHDFSDNYRARPDLGGGMVLDIACYPVSVLMWLWPDAVATNAVVLHVERNKYGADMHSEISLSLSNAVTATVTVSSQRPARRWFEVVGSDGVLRAAEPAFSHSPEPHEGTRLWLDSRDESQEWRIPASDPRKAMLEHWADVLDGGTTTAVDARLSVRAAHALDVMMDAVSLASSR